MSCSRAQHGAACGDRTHDLSILSPTLYHYAIALPHMREAVKMIMMMIQVIKIMMMIIIIMIIIMLYYFPLQGETQMY